MEFNLIDNYKLSIVRSGKKYKITLVDPVRSPIPIRTLGKEFWFDWTRKEEFVAEMAEKIGCRPKDLIAPLEVIAAEIALIGKKILDPQRPPKKIEPSKEAEKVDPTQYFTEREDGSVGEFVPKRLADDIRKDHRFATHRESWVIYRYQDGIYLPDGEATIRELCRKKLGELAKECHVNEVIKHIQDTTFRLSADFNPLVNLICLENGIFDIDSGELKSHTPDLIFLNKVPVPYNPDAKAPACGRYLAAWMNMKHLIRAIQFLGFCLYRDYLIRKALIAVGEGGNGKSTFVLWMSAWLGRDNVCTITAQALDKNKFSAAVLAGKLANLCDDMPSAKWFNTGGFKQATGGAPMTGEVKFKNPFDFINHAKMGFTANRLPIVGDDTQAFWERIMLLTFSNHFDGKVSRDKILKEMLTPDERAGILNAALVGLQMLRDAGDFFMPDDIDFVRSQYIHLSDPAAAFAEDRLREGPDEMTPKDKIYGAYVNYCKEQGFNPTINSVFAKQLVKVLPNVRAGRPTIDGEKVTVWYGIGLKSQEECEAEEVKLPNLDRVDRADRGANQINIIAKMLNLNDNNSDVCGINLGTTPVSPATPVQPTPPNKQDEQPPTAKSTVSDLKGDECGLRLTSGLRRPLREGQKLTAEPTVSDQKTPSPVTEELEGAKESPTWLPCEFIADHPRSVFIDPDTDKNIELGPFERGDTRGIPAQSAHQMAQKGIVEIMKETAGQPEDLGKIATLPLDIQGLPSAAAILAAISDGAPYLQYKIPKMANVPRQVCFDTLATLEEKGYVNFEDWGEKVAVKITDKGKEAVK